MEPSSADTVSETVELSMAASSVYVKGVVSDLVGLTSQQLLWPLGTWGPQSWCLEKPLSRLQ